MKTSTIKSNLIKALRIPLVTAFCLLIWWILATIVDNSYFLPTVKETFFALISLIKLPGFFKAIIISLLRVAVGLVIGIICGTVLGTVSHLIKVANYLISPIISIMKATPVATIILILWFTFTDASLAVFVVFLMVTPIVWQNVYDGYKSISPELREVCDVFEFSYAKRIRLLVFPAVFKYLIPAIITSIGLAWKAEIAAEIMTYSNIGRSIQDFKTLHYDTASVFAWAVVIIVLSLILENIAKYLLRRIRI